MILIVGRGILLENIRIGKYNTRQSIIPSRHRRDIRR
jgi:hypothetical protein